MFNSSEAIDMVNRVRIAVARGYTIYRRLYANYEETEALLKDKYLEIDYTFSFGVVSLFVRRKKSSLLATYKRFDNRPANSKAPKGDCSTRSMSLVTGVPYNTIYQKQKVHGSNWNEVNESILPIMGEYGYTGIVFGKKRCPFHRLAFLLAKLHCKACIVSSTHMTATYNGEIIDAIDSRLHSAIGVIIPARYIKKAETLLADYI